MLHTTKRGFTLLELSIVIVIIGLIVAGISAGQSLVQAATIRSTMSEITQLRTALTAFKLQYDDIPGDMTNATSYWSSANPATANGNGNGYIGSISTTASESVHALYQLSLAGMLDGNFDGTNRIPVNYGTGNIESGFYADTYWGKWPRMRALETGGGNHLPENVLNIDTKYDDGMPGTGFIVSYSFTDGVCTQNRVNGSFNAETETYIPGSGFCSRIVQRLMY